MGTVYHRRSRCCPIVPCLSVRYNRSQAQVLEASEDQVQSLINEATQATVIAKMADADWDEAPSLTASLAPARSYLSPRQDSTTVLFCQGIVQEVLSAEVPTSQARRLHWAIGAALEASYAGSAPVHAAELARHYALSGDKPAALQWSLLTGENAVR